MHKHRPSQGFPLLYFSTVDGSTYYPRPRGGIQVVRPSGFREFPYESYVFIPSLNSVMDKFSKSVDKRFQGYSQKDYLEMLRSYMESSPNRVRDCLIVNTADVVLRVIPTMPVRGGLFLSFWNLSTKEVDFSLPVATEPAIGDYPFCQARITHPSSPVRDKILGSAIKEVHWELPKRNLTSPLESLDFCELPRAHS